MAKDPAFLFYPGDWLGGTMGMTFEQKGCYFELLMLQFNIGKFTEQQARHTLGASYDAAWQIVKCKFKTDGTIYWNEKLDSEKQKRRNFTDSRKKNLHKETHMQTHTEQRMENENENVIDNTNAVDIEERKSKFISDASLFRNTYTDEMLKSFCEYWMEKNEGGKKMRFEMEKVFELSRRLATWKNNESKFSKYGKQALNARSITDALEKRFAEKRGTQPV